jgi:uncharacterized repeat protein (TIGR01451 family)
MNMHFVEIQSLKEITMNWINVKTIKIGVALGVILGVFVSPSHACPPCIEVWKWVEPEVSKIGDDVVYTICVKNCGEIDLNNIAVEDPLLGGILSDFPSTLAVGEIVCRDFKYKIKPDDPDPLVNVVTVSGEDKDGNQVVDSNTATVDLVKVGIDITKAVDNTNPCFGDIVTYTICIENTGEWPLEHILVEDPQFVGILAGFPDMLDVGEVACVSFEYEVKVNDTCPLVNCAKVRSDPLGPMTNCIKDEACVEICPQPCGEEGCTPGFWKNNGDKHSASAWCDLFTPSMRISDVFILNEPLVIRGKGKSTITDPTLLQALGANGGGINAMIRHGIAAMLNACSDCVNYPNNNPLEIIMMIEDALNGAPGAYTVDELHAMFASWNETGCPINQHGECVGVED